MKTISKWIFFVSYKKKRTVDIIEEILFFLREQLFEMGRREKKKLFIIIRINPLAEK